MIVIFVLALLPAAGSPIGLFRPDPVRAQSETTIGVITDYGSCDGTQSSVANLVNNTLSPAIVVTAGDNYHKVDGCDTYTAIVGNKSDGTGYYGAYAQSSGFMPALGNHDYDARAPGLDAYNTYFSWLPTDDDSQRRWYDFTQGDLHFFVVDSQSALYYGTMATQKTWLQGALGASTSAWNIVVLHHAPYSTGYYGDNSSMQWPFAAWGVDFVIAGHNHHYERILADGIRYFIAGYGGTAVHSQCDGSTSGTSEECVAEVPGAMKITASSTSITLAYYNTSGDLVGTAYTQAASSDPIINVSASLVPFSSYTSIPSVAQNYTVSGSNLTDDVTVTPPTGYELSTDSSTYSSSPLMLTPTGGDLAATTVYGRLYSATAGTYSGSITHTSTGATQVDIAVEGTVEEPVSIYLPLVQEGP